MKKTVYYLLVACSFVGWAQAGDPVAGKQKAVTCIECHGDDGAPGKDGVPKIDRMPPDNFATVIKTMRETHYDIPITAHALSEQDVEDIAAYFAYGK